ncbi:Ppx/GppA family phosphatase [Salinibacillus xinjiangensis]|uniref:Ppx/GppA family phosphatase n=1 Tax=Salinibacillus xinjiangensis TaxID=1229268 RepID=UPI00129B372F|nr:Ppx/GppA family phosphatase [Salinibacillus xinjiangensis]
MTERVGIIDIGSNTIRLVIYERLESWKHFEELENIKITARLRSYFDETQSLNEAGIERLMTALEEFHNILEHYKVNEFICVATASIRQAANKEEILQIVKEKIQITIKLLGDYEEAFYGVNAVLHSIPINEGITIDIGGGSTEITYFKDRTIKQYHSFPFGALSLKLQFVKGDIPTDEERKHIRKYLFEQFQAFPWITNRQAPVIAIGGSARNVGQIHQQLIKYPLDEMHQYEMSLDDIVKTKEDLLPLSYIELQKTDGLSKDRADTILPAFEVFEVVCNMVHATKFIISRRGLRDGILYQKWMDNDHSNLPLLDVSIAKFRKNFYIGTQDEKQLLKIAAVLFEAVQTKEEISDQFTKQDFTLLALGARIFHLGKKATAETSSDTFHLLVNRTILGLSHRDKLKLALVSSYKGKGTFQKYLRAFKEWFTPSEQKTLCVLGAILKISQSLNISNQNTVIDLQISKEDKVHWMLHVICKGYYRPEEYHFEKQKKHLEKLLKLTLDAKFHIK